MHMALSMARGVVTFSAMILYAIAYQGWTRVCSILTFAVMLGFDGVIDRHPGHRGERHAVGGPSSGSTPTR